MNRPTQMFLLWLFVVIARPQDLWTSLESIRPVLTLSIVTSLLVFVRINTREIMDALSVPEAKQYLTFYLLMIAGIPFAYHKGVAFESVIIGYSMNILFFVIFVAI